MPTPSLTPEQLAQVSGLVAQYIATQRENALPHALPLDTKQRAAVDGFFLPEVLDGARLLALGGIRVENPTFYPTLRGISVESHGRRGYPARTSHQTQSRLHAHEQHGR